MNSSKTNHVTWRLEADRGANRRAVLPTGKYTKCAACRGSCDVVRQLAETKKIAGSERGESPQGCAVPNAQSHRGRVCQLRRKEPCARKKAASYTGERPLCRVRPLDIFLTTAAAAAVSNRNRACFELSTLGAKWRDSRPPLHPSQLTKTGEANTALASQNVD